MNTYLNTLVEGQGLTVKEAQKVAQMILRGELSQAQIAAILIALRMKGESVDELTGFINGIKTHMIPVKYEGAIDVCGTGGDGKHTFNISSTVALVTAAAGIPIAKHGNTAVSSSSGSADVFKALGVNIMLTATQAEEVLKNAGIVFLFAPLYHPTFKNVGPVRKELGVRTIFNYLGPLINPAQVKRQIIGVPNTSMAERLAQVGKNLGYEHLLIVTSEDGMDEVSISASTHMYDIKGNSVQEYRLDPQEYGFEKAPLSELVGGTARENAHIIHTILNNTPGPKRDIVVLNSACALYVGGKVKSIQEGIDLSNELLNSRKAKKVLETLIKESQKYA